MGCCCSHCVRRKSTTTEELEGSVDLSGEDSLPYSVEVSDTGDNHLQVVPIELADGNRSELTGDLIDLNMSLPPK